MVRSVRVSLLLCLILVAISLPSSRASSDTDMQVELVNLQTSDGTWLNGVLRQVAPTQTKAAVMMVHGYSGNFYSGIMASLPAALTGHGFTTLALNMRDHDRGPKKNLFEENLQDIAAGVDELARRQYKALFLYGHSMGTNRVLYYQAATRDPRVVGVILTAPPGNLFQWNVRVFGLEAATRVLRRAQRLKGKGKGNEWMLVDLGPLGKTLYTANHLVSLRGPETRSDPFINIARISKPILIVHGLADRLADSNVADQLRKSAGTESQVALIKVAGADHLFHGREETLKKIIYQWLVEQLRR